MSEVHERIIRELYRHLVLIDPTPCPVEDYIGGDKTEAQRLAVEIVGDANESDRCAFCRCGGADHMPGTSEDPFCADCCPECNEEDA